MNIFKSGNNLIGNSTALWLGAFNIYNDMHRARSENKSVFAAGARSFTSNGIGIALMMGAVRGNAVNFAYEALRMAPMLAGMGQSFVTQRMNSTRLAGTQFSTSFEHSDFTMNMQQAGLASINRSRSTLGSEAGIFARRYGR